MCFSMSASFSAALLLSTIGVFTLSRWPSKKTRYFAAIPLFFGIQQFFEGIVWLSSINSEYAFLRQIGGYCFLFFAYSIWPFWTPLSLFMLEQQKKRKKILRFIMIFGFLLSLYLFFYLFTHTLSISACAHHIEYITGINHASNYTLVYLIPTIVPFFITSWPYMWGFGILIIASYLLSQALWQAFSVSVWCFFAALLSGAIILILQFSPDLHSSQHTTKRHLD